MVDVVEATAVDDADDGMVERYDDDLDPISAENNVEFRLLQ